MIAGAALRSLLGQVTQPETGYNVVDISGHDGFSIGRGRGNSVVLLTPPDAAPDAPTRLDVIRLDPKIRCLIESPHGPQERDHGLIEFYEGEQALLSPFLEVATALVRLLGPEPAPGEVSRGMRAVVRLFAEGRPVRGEVLGLWGELLLMTLVDEPQPLIDAWHATVDERFDFASAGARVEVKTTARAERIHHFNLVQLLPVEKADRLVVSIMTTRTDAGTSVQELVARLESLLSGDAQRQMKIHLQVAEVLGSGWMQQVSAAFDELQAQDSLRVFEAQFVPRVEPGPSSVLAVDLTVDCSDLPTAPVIVTDLAAFVSKSP